MTTIGPFGLERAEAVRVEQAGLVRAIVRFAELVADVRAEQAVQRVRAQERRAA